MARLTAKARKKIPAGKFAGPGRSFPVEDKAHARAALQDLPKAKHLTLQQAQRIHAKAEKMLGNSK